MPVPEPMFLIIRGSRGSIVYLTNTDMVELTAWRRELHRHPELSGEEQHTAQTVAKALTRSNPDQIVTGLGGHGIAAIFNGAEPGPTLMFRAELDGLPIHDLGPVEHHSIIPGKGHQCGHDGHMSILIGLARVMARRRPARGRVILLFQPAEENGAGAAAVIADEKFSQLDPEYVFALHNFPGIPQGQVALAAGPANCASRGVKIALTGKTAHASQPETGTSPMLAVSTLMPALLGLGGEQKLDAHFKMVTITHARMGEPAFGVAPGEAEIYATLRTLTDNGMHELVGAAEELVRTTSQRYGLTHDIAYADIFRHCENHPDAVAHLESALNAEQIAYSGEGLPMRGSEDFGRFGDQAKSAMFLLGAGEDQPALHNPDYDFPDDLIPAGTRIFARVVEQMLG